MRHLSAKSLNHKQVDPAVSWGAEKLTSIVRHLHLTQRATQSSTSLEDSGNTIVFEILIKESELVSVASPTQLSLNLMTWPFWRLRKRKHLQNKN